MEQPSRIRKSQRTGGSQHGSWNQVNSSTGYHWSNPTLVQSQSHASPCPLGESKYQPKALCEKLKGTDTGQWMQRQRYLEGPYSQLWWQRATTHHTEVALEAGKGQELDLAEPEEGHTNYRFACLCCINTHICHCWQWQWNSSSSASAVTPHPASLHLFFLTL